MKTTTICFEVATILTSACNSESGTKPAHSKTSTDISANAAPTEKNKPEELAIGTDIKSLVKAPAPQTKSKNSVQTIEWDDLIPEDYDVEAIVAKFQGPLMLALEGSPEEIAIYKEMQKEFNKAPPNKALHAKTVKIPGFVAPLDEANGVVGDFLLVPYFGACIHAPPPPVNQTVFVSPENGKSISISEIDQPVWVVGKMHVERSVTDLADAGYRIESAQLEIYSPE